MTIRGILFDKDGTLLDYDATWVPINRKAARLVANGDDRLAMELLRLGGQDDGSATVASGSVLAAGTTVELAALWARHAPAHGFADLTAALDDIFQREGAVHAAPVSGLVDTLRRLETQGLILGVATSDSEAGALATLEPFDVLQYFDFVAGYDSGFGPKPEPGMVLAFCRAAGLSPEEVMVVGDNRHDMEMGARGKVGLRVGVLTGTSRHEELAPLADHVLTNIAEIIGLIQRVEGG
ncbi:MAG: HAD family hydrolase [Rhodospirillaceae bacterium]|mgnify:FL=1|jgi:phosphoglycolate phosphatase|nr:HAD family hydrolase [Rhodospirillaceae bacterium]MBT5894847.1 HAD family hydrolase [Rhodospirillaceae bacterium]MBT6431413.1 HAD family hydrolase [Rhodospirillaceae bacterium]MBT7760772.1 HAD family hydrolase [Rhodospirillaceae bacterium]